MSTRKRKHNGAFRAGAFWINGSQLGGSREQSGRAVWLRYWPPFSLGIVQSPSIAFAATR
jgi:hypothetical protein